MTETAGRLRVDSGGVALAVLERSRPGPDRPTLVLLHGYPDDQTVWDPLVAALPRDELHVVTYDARGAGESTPPERVSDYRTERLVDDLVAVLDAVAPRGRVHLVGHDWGSVQLWDAVLGEACDPRLRGRIGSFTSISGPALDHLGWLARHQDGRRRRLLKQAARSWYVYAFQLPVVPELVWRAGSGVIARLAGAGDAGARHFGPRLPDNAVNGLNLYRANLRRPAGLPRPTPTEVPVLVVHPSRDAFLTDVVLEDLDRLCAQVRVVRVDAGHWVIYSHPEAIAALVTEQVRSHS